MRRSIKGPLYGLIIGLIGGLFGLSTFGADFEKTVGLEWLFNTRGKIKAPSGSVVIAIDGLTGEKLDMSALPRDWPRSIHGELVEALVNLGVSTIVFDIDFHKQKSPRNEELFAAAVRQSGRVVMLQLLRNKGQVIEDKTGNKLGNVWVEELLSPIPILAQAARGLAPFPLPKYAAAVHEFWVFKSSAGEVPTLPAVGLQMRALPAYPQFYRLLGNSGLANHVKIPESAAHISSADELRNFMNGIRSALSEMPKLADKLTLELKKSWVEDEPEEIQWLLKSLVSMYIGNNERYLNLYGPPGTVQTIPYHRIIENHRGNDIDENLNLTNKVVFVGYSDFFDPDQPDKFYTVFTNRQGIDLSGVEIAATAFANLLHDQSLHIPGGISRLATLFAFGLLLTLLIYFTPVFLGVPGATAVVAGYVLYSQLLFNDSYLW
ncbi:MAG: hypothetical protein DRR42_22580, partial [Gammaproteobacteria bacterium]